MLIGSLSTGRLAIAPVVLGYCMLGWVAVGASQDVMVSSTKYSTALSFSSNGNLYEGGVRESPTTGRSLIWEIDPQSGKVLRTFEASFSGRVDSISSSQDGRKLLAVNISCESTVFDKDGKILNSFRQFIGAGTEANGACFAKGGSAVLLSSRFPALFRNDLSSNRSELLPIISPTKTIDCTVFGQDGYRCAYSDGKEVTVFEKSLAECKGFIQIAGRPHLMALSRDESLLAVVSEKTIELYRIGKLLHPSSENLALHRKPVDGFVTSIKAIKGGFVLSNTAGQVIVVDERLERLSELMPLGRTRINSIALSGDDEWLAVCGEDSDIRIMRRPWKSDR